MKLSTFMFTLVCALYCIPAITFAGWYSGEKFTSIYAGLELEYTINEDDESVTCTDVRWPNFSNSDCLEIPDTVKYYLDSFNCLSLVVTHIADGAFSSEKCKKAILPNTLTSIGERAFHHSKLTEIVIPNSVRFIGDRAFYECKDLIKVTLPNSLEYVGEFAFHDYFGLGFIAVREINIPDSLKFIGKAAFLGCKTPTIVKLDNVVTLGESALALTPIQQLFIGKHLESIGGDLFGRCYDLERIEVDKENPVYDSRNNCNAIIETTTNRLVGGCKNSYILADIASIGAYAMYNGNITSFEYPICSRIETIENSAFGCQYSLKSIILPLSMRIIGDYAFYESYSARVVVLPPNLEEIGNRAFYRSEASYRYYPDGSKKRYVSDDIVYAYPYIPKYSEIPEIYAMMSHPERVSIANDSFDRIEKALSTLHVPKGCLERYRSADVWKDFVHIVDDISAPVGDVNGDGMVDVDDINVIVNIMLKKD